MEGRIERRFAAPRADLAVRKLAALEALARHGRATPRLLGSVGYTPAAWPTSALLDLWGVLRRVPGIPQGEARLVEVQRLLRSRLVAGGTTLKFSTEAGDDWWWLMDGPDANAARLVLAATATPGWRTELPQLVNGALARQQRGAWSTTTANLWGGLALERFAAVMESVPVAPTPFTARHEGAGRPWLTLQTLAAVPLQAPLAAGYRLTRSVTAVQRQRPEVWSRGDIQRVRLEIEAVGDMAWVVVSNLLRNACTYTPPVGGQRLAGLRGARAGGLAQLLRMAATRPPRGGVHAAVECQRPLRPATHAHRGHVCARILRRASQRRTGGDALRPLAAAASALLLLATAPALAVPDFNAVRAAHAPSDLPLLDRHGAVLQTVRVDDSVRRGPDPLRPITRLQEDLARPAGGRSVGQKLTQMHRARQLESGWSKTQILEAYLNRVPLRGELVGVAAASHMLFGKHASGLDAVEAALLASMVRGPNAGAPLPLALALAQAQAQAQAQPCTARSTPACNAWRCRRCAVKSPNFAAARSRTAPCSCSTTAAARCWPGWALRGRRRMRPRSMPCSPAASPVPPSSPSSMRWRCSSG